MHSEAPLGILMLDTRFPRPRGDIGCAASFPFPVVYRTIPQASASGAVRGDEEALYQGFVDGAWALVAEGVAAIATSCGFLSVFQDRLQSALPVPVVTSALLSYQSMQARLPKGQRIGVLTIDAAALSARHLAAAGIPEDASIIGLPRDGPLATTIFGDLDHLDIAGAEREMIDAALRLREAEPALGGVLLECTNMGPYADAVRTALGLPVRGIVEALKEVMGE